MSAVLGWPLRAPRGRLRVPWLARGAVAPFSYLCVRCWGCIPRLLAYLLGSVAAFAVAPLWALALVGLLRRVAPPRHPARPLGALASLGTAVFCFSRLARGAAVRIPAGFPPRAGLRGLPRIHAPRVPVGGGHCLFGGGRNAPPPCAPSGGGSAAANFLGALIAAPQAPRLVFFMVLLGSRPLNFPK